MNNRLIPILARLAFLNAILSFLEWKYTNIIVGIYWVLVMVYWVKKEEVVNDKL